jgi:hypothetical protein
MAWKNDPCRQYRRFRVWSVYGYLAHRSLDSWHAGFLPLAKLPVLRWLGGDQFRKFCVVAMAILVVTVWITCICHEEKERFRTTKSSNKSATVMPLGLYDTETM